MNKKILAGLLVAPLVFTLSGCKEETPKYNAQEILEKTVTNYINDSKAKSSFTIDGTMAVDIAEEATTQNMDMKLNGNSFLIKSDDDAQISFDLNFDMGIQESADKTNTVKGGISSIIANEEILIKVNSLDLGEMSDPSITTMLALFQDKWIKLPTEGLEGNNIMLKEMLNPANKEKQIADTLQIIQIKEDKGIANGNYTLAVELNSEGMIKMIKDYYTENKVEMGEEEFSQMEEVLKMMETDALLTISPDFRFQKMDMTITTKQVIEGNNLSIDFKYLWQNESITDADTIVIPENAVNLEEMMQGMLGGGMMNATTPDMGEIEGMELDMEGLNELDAALEELETPAAEYK